MTVETAPSQPARAFSLKRSGGITGDTIFRGLLIVATLLLTAIVGLMAWNSLTDTLPVFQRFGVAGFVLGSRWSPAFTVYGALPFIYGTLLTSAIALMIAVPLAVLIAILVTELLPPHVSQPVAVMVDLLAAVPSVVWGLWGLLVLIPFIRPFEQTVSGSVGQAIPFLGGPTPGPSYFTAGLVVGIMIIPIVAALTREVFAATPRLQREAVLALGGTGWDVIRSVVIPIGRTGLAAAVVLGLGRAIGETIAVTLVVGNAPKIGQSIFSPGFTLASVIANEFNEATEELHAESLLALGVVLLVLAVIVNGIGLFIRQRFARGPGGGR